MNKIMMGEVVGFGGPYTVVECVNAPAHLQVLELTRIQSAGAQKGERVRLEYRSSRSSGAWIVVERLDVEAKREIGARLMSAFRPE